MRSKLLVKRWFREGDDWVQLERYIDASFEEQKAFYANGTVPASAYPDDIAFLMEGLCEKPSVLREISKGVYNV